MKNYKGVFAAFVIGLSLIIITFVLVMIDTSDLEGNVERVNEWQPEKKEIVYIAKDLTDKTEYDNVMNLQHLFSQNDNITFIIYDCKGMNIEQNKQISNIDSADLVIINPINSDALIPLIESKEIPTIVIGKNISKNNIISVNYSEESTSELVSVGITSNTRQDCKLQVFTNDLTTQEFKLVLSSLQNVFKKQNRDEITDITYTGNVNISTIRVNDDTTSVLIMDDGNSEEILNHLALAGFNGYRIAVSSNWETIYMILDGKVDTVIFKDGVANCIYNLALKSLQGEEIQSFTLTQSSVNIHNINQFLKSDKII